MKEVRVRFAPSPTGYVHVGSLRTALYNYLFARHHNGKLILRIEDTDQSRYVEGAVDNLLSTMSWANLEYDEGPQKEGGYGPYFQSKRLDIYNKHMDILIRSDNAYPCFCSSERLNKVREEQAEKNESIMYDGACRHIPKEEALLRMQQETHVIRLKIPEGETVIEDIIRGEVRFENGLIDDQVLIKTDGFPTYHLANVVDDHLMRISHVIRGEEWLPSTPKHVILYQAFGWELPQFAHLPLLLNRDRSKLSKRQGDVAVEDYRKKGFLVEALVNFVALLGWNKGDDTEIFSLTDLVDSFSLERVNKAGAVFDTDKLNWMNGHYIRSMPEDEYYAQGLKWMAALKLDSGNAEKNRLILQALRDHLNRFDELPEKSELFFKDRLNYSADALEWIGREESKNVFHIMAAELKSHEIVDLEVFKKLMAKVQKESGVKGKNLWMPVRAAITGLTSGPELPVVIQVLGKAKVDNFVKQAIDL